MDNQLRPPAPPPVPEHSLPSLPPPDPTPAADRPVVAKFKPPHQGVRRFGLLLLMLLLIAGGAGGGYYWQHTKLQSLSRQVTSLNLQLHEETPPITAKTSSGTASDELFSVSSDPASFSSQEVTLTLSLPAGSTVLPYSEDLGAATTNSSILNLFAASYNDLIGRFYFSNTAFTASPTAAPSGESYLYVAAAGDWLKSNDPTNGSVNYATGSDIAISGISLPSSGLITSQKSSLLSQLATATAACAKSAGSGFTMDNGAIAVCDDVAQDGRTMTVAGYGDIDGQPVIVGGTINLGSGLNAAQYVNALKGTTLSVSAL